MSVSNLSEFLEERTGGLLRGIARYNGTTSDVLHLREDVKQQRMRSEIDRILYRVRPEAFPKEEQSFPFGDLYATVRVFEEAILLHFPTDIDQGIVVSLEPDVATELNTFIGKCLERLEE